MGLELRDGQLKLKIGVRDIAMTMSVDGIYLFIYVCIMNMDVPPFYM